MSYESEAAIRVGGVSAREQLQTRWGLILVIFMRLLAALWIVEGLAQWAQFMLPAGEIFDHMSTGQTAAIVFFSVIDLLAAVGLWLATPWGGVLWLFAAISQIAVAFGAGPILGRPAVGAPVFGRRRPRRPARRRRRAAHRPLLRPDLAGRQGLARRLIPRDGKHSRRVHQTIFK